MHKPPTQVQYSTYQPLHGLVHGDQQRWAPLRPEYKRSRHVLIIIVHAFVLGYSRMARRRRQQCTCKYLNPHPTCYCVQLGTACRWYLESSNPCQWHTNMRLFPDWRVSATLAADGCRSKSAFCLSPISGFSTSTRQVSSSHSSHSLPMAGF
jgi:hypothetical protein